MTLPNQSKMNSDMVCRLNKSIYGLKKSPKCWNEKFDLLMIKESFVRSENDFCLYSRISGDTKTFILLYVDDVLYFSTNALEIDKIKKMLSNNFSMKDLGQVSQYLGINVKQNINMGYTELDQSEYLKQVLRKFKMYDCKPIATPLDANFDVKILREGDLNQELVKKCRQIIGSLIYAVSGTRPDLCQSVALLSRYQDKANQNLYKTLKRVLRYVKATLDLKLIFKINYNNEVLQGYVDSDWGGDVVDRKSTSGYIFKLFGCVIDWASKKQHTVALSSTESEYFALTLAISQVCWLRKIISDFKVVSLEKPTTIFEDNQSAIKIANNPENNKRLKHVEIKICFIKEKIDSGLVEIKYIKTEEQIADMLTKSLGKVKFQKFVFDMRLEK